MRVALDLFCGTGGATAAFSGRPGWDVIGVDIDPRSKADVFADVRDWRPGCPRVEFIWASRHRHIAKLRRRAGALLGGRPADVGRP